MRQLARSRLGILALGLLCVASAPAQAQPEAAKAAEPATRRKLPAADPATAFKRPSRTELMRLVAATPAGRANLLLAEKQGVKLHGPPPPASPDCQYPACIEATPRRAGQYYEGWKLWAQDVVWEGGLYPSIYLKAGSADASGQPVADQRRPRALLQLQVQSPFLRPGVTWYVVTFDVCRGWQPPSPRYSGRVRARVLQGLTRYAETIDVQPTAEVELDAFDSQTFPGAGDICFTLPVLARLRPREPNLHTNAFTLEVLQGELTLVRATARPL